MASMQKRLQKELLALQNDPPPGMTLNEKSVQNSITQWIVDMEGAPGTLYEGEKFQLLFKFSSRYPFDSPQKTGPRRSQCSQSVSALSACFPAAKKREDHQTIPFMCEHVTRIQRKQNGGIMCLLSGGTRPLELALAVVQGKVRIGLRGHGSYSRGKQTNKQTNKPFLAVL
ncbi:ubiquitin-conjugating enzyme E2 W isoform X3 [Grammomys surdaster]|uniref:ubiquitin-conjugating enzyme E2 W isoform X3 n=1 Tax=Grammomys surdaster TaxID=491861 RepID=UPI0010A01A3F|nr:ubiquitin-conjugating enzyme E2 W isoform X3 [Grammomys surdaster]